jgi:3-deoxy-D-manno-octulosonic-acid transferase
MISQVDAERIREIGLSGDKIRVLGNAKYDGLAALVSPELREETVRRFDARPEERFFVAGSTHPGEEEIVIRVYRELADADRALKLILVPRHVERAGDVAAVLSQAGFADLIRVSEMRAGRRGRRSG